MEEIWRDIAGYEELYQVSNFGRVKSLGHRLGSGNNEKILKPGKDKGGYLVVVLCKCGKPKPYRVHRLVLSTFNPIEEIENLEVDHINTIRTDNRLENLRWTTHKENSNNPLTRVHNSEAQKGENNPNYGKFGVKHPKSIPIVQLSLDGKLVNVYDSLMEAEKNGFNNSAINQCIKGKKKTHKGYKWMYLHEFISHIHPNIKTINLMGKTYEVNQ